MGARRGRAEPSSGRALSGNSGKLWTRSPFPSLIGRALRELLTNDMDTGAPASQFQTQIVAFRRPHGGFAELFNDNVRSAPCTDEWRSSAYDKWWRGLLSSHFQRFQE